MSKTNYANMYKSTSDETLGVDTKPKTVDKESHTKKQPETVVGVVVNCKRLNIRSKPNLDSEILYTIPVDSEIVITKSRSTKEWLSVCTEIGVEGFCVASYVSLLPSSIR